MKQLISHLTRILPDAWFVNLLYAKHHGRFPDLKHPRTFNEKVQWYKLYYRSPLMTRVTDKYEVRRYVTEKGLSGLLNDLYGVYESAAEIDFDRLPERFVLKATHGCNMNIICKDRAKLDPAKSRALMERWLKTDYSCWGREWAYKDVKPRLICERYLENEEMGELIDYKFYCFGGKPAGVFICSGRFSPGGVRYSYYDLDWNRVDLVKGKPEGGLHLERPEAYQRMIEIAETLSEGFPFIRVDLYLVREKIIFGELTFYPDSGVNPFYPDRYNDYFGDLFALPDKCIPE